MKAKALIVGDDVGLLTLLRFGFQQDGLAVVVVDDGQLALRTAYETHPDIIILDVNLAGVDGWVLCRRLRYMTDVPIIILSASADERDVIKGLSLGADEYLTKPRGLEELKARVRAALRRARMNSNRARRPVYDDGELRVDLVTGAVTRGDEAVHLTPTEARLLMCLVSRRGEVVPHRELLSTAWGQEYAEAVDYLSVYIRYLRQKIEEDPSSPRYIRTRWGIGYYFAGDGTSPPGNDGD
jgi:two-component system KDP operon response regulator KdpE